MYCACESLRFRETRDLKELKGREGLDNWSWFMEDPIQLPNSNPDPTESHLFPMKAKSGEELGELKSLARAGDEGEGSSWLRDL